MNMTTTRVASCNVFAPPLCEAFEFSCAGTPAT